jgi:tetratricopeptide (TPR) repeat protein
MESARVLLSQGEYRKSLLIIKSLLKNQPDLIEALYLSALNWFHLDDRPKTILYLEQIIQYNPVYSAECFKILAVCHFKSMEYNRSLMRVMLISHS